MAETGFSSWVTTQGPLMHASHAALARAFMTSTLSPEQIAFRDWRKHDGSKDRASLATHDEFLASQAKPRASFSSRIAERRRERAEAAYAD